MTRALIILAYDADRRRAAQLAMQAPVNTRVEFKAPRRSEDQSRLMWARLGDISRQLKWHGQRYSKEDWKEYMLHALKRTRWMPFEDGGMVPIGMRTSDLSREEMSELLDFIDAFGARHGVTFKEEERT